MSFTRGDGVFQPDLKEVDMAKRAFLAILLFFVSYSTAAACTSAVISGRATLDGRPILWKNRDTSKIENKLIYIKGEKYDLIGVANNSDAVGDSIWMGSNSAGFSIVNTLSYNLNIDRGYEDLGPLQRAELMAMYDRGSGSLMRLALGTCATLEDFELLLKDPGLQSSNFGVIDAYDGAAYYEVGNEGYKKFDVNDLEVAPSGYLIRTNFSASGDMESAKGVIRYNTTKELFDLYYSDHEFSVDFILSKAVRNLGNSLTKTDISKMELPKDLEDTTFAPVRDCIVRNSTASSMVVKGVKTGEDPSLTTIWTILGFPLTTLVTPVWVAAGDQLPQWVVSTQGALPLINKRSLELKAICFPVTIGHGPDYLEVAAVLNQQGTGIYQEFTPKMESVIREAANMFLSIWYEDGFSAWQALCFYRLLDIYLPACYDSGLGDSSANLFFRWQYEQSPAGRLGIPWPD